jgi:hypothetical protein
MWMSLAATAWLLLSAVPGHSQTCERADFESAVGTASMTLREMTNRNTPEFQDKLRALKEKRGWSTEEFVKAAAPLVADDRIAEFDQKSAEFLMKINNLGGEGANTEAPDCRLLEALRASMTQLVETQTQKWAYMFGKLEAEMAK